MVQTNYTTEWQPIIGFHGKTIGKSDGRIFRKNIQGSKHLLRTPRAIAIDACALDELPPTIQIIEVFDTENSKNYTTTIGNFHRYKMELDRGFGRQYALTLNRWSIIDPNSSLQMAFPLPCDPYVSPQMAFVFTWSSNV